MASQALLTLDDLSGHQPTREAAWQLQLYQADACATRTVCDMLYMPVVTRGSEVECCNASDRQLGDLASKLRIHWQLHAIAQLGLQYCCEDVFIACQQI